MVYRRVAVAVAAVLVTSASAHAWDPTVVGFVDSNTDASPAATVTDDSPARIAHASAAKFGPEMVSEATIADDTVYAVTEPSPARVAYASAAAKFGPEMVSEAAIADEVAEASPAGVASAPAQAEGLGSGAAVPEDGGQDATLAPKPASTRSSR